MGQLTQNRLDVGTTDASSRSGSEDTKSALRPYSDRPIVERCEHFHLTEILYMPIIYLSPASHRPRISPLFVTVTEYPGLHTTAECPCKRRGLGGSATTLRRC